MKFVPKEPLPSMAAVELSTSHITRSDNDVLTEMATGDDPFALDYYPDLLLRRPLEYLEGFILVVPTRSSVPHWPAAQRRLRKHFSAAFVKLLGILRQRKIRLLVLDRDAPEVGWLPKFEW